MKTSRFLTYAAAIIVIAGGAIWYIIGNAQQREAGEGTSQVVMYKNPGCQCCTAWAVHMEENGFTVREEPRQDMPAVKANYGVPYTMASCHTAVIGDYVVEGHVPASEVKRLLKEQPDAQGLAVPGMPVGSPGMEQGGRSEPYDVMLFSDSGSRVYESYQ